MLNAELILVLQLLKLLLRFFFARLLILGLWLKSTSKIVSGTFSDEQNLNIVVLQIIGLDGRPGATAELLEDPVANVTSNVRWDSRIKAYSLGKSGF